MNERLLASGYRFSGIVSGLRSEPNRRDLAVIVSDRPAQAAGVFTQNQVCAAPVQVSRSRLPRPDARAIVICSGNANACTGEQGLRDAERMAALVAAGINCPAEQVLVASTGVIGRPLPMAILEAGIPRAVKAVQATDDSFVDAAHAILTTDTKIKTKSLKVGDYTFTGFAKGAAMIGPNMATMLGFVLTDAPIASDILHRALLQAVDVSFNCISVEGHTSTNDTVFVLANGAGPSLTFAEVVEPLTKLCMDLAMQIAADAEGASHLITIDVEGTRTDAEAKKIARAIAESALVKTAVFGADPNWGRIVSAAGYAGVPFAERDLSCWMGDLLLYKDGTPLPFDEAVASAYLKDNRQVSFRLKFQLGAGRCRFYTSDLTYEYVKLNADYTT